MEKTQSGIEKWIALLRTALFYLALTVELAVVIADKSALINPWESYLFRATFAMTLLVVLLSGYTRRQWAVIVVALVLTTICYLYSGRNELLRMAVFLFACKEQDMERALRYTFVFTLAGCVLLAVLSLTGLFGDASLTAHFGGRGGTEITRYTLGLGHPNALHCMVLMLIMLLLYLRRESGRLYLFLLMALINIASFALTDSRTGVAAGMLGIVLFLTARYAGEKKWFYGCGILAVLLCIGFSVWAACASIFAWNGGLTTRIDRLLTGRIVALYWGTESHAGAVQTWRLIAGRDTEVYFDMGWVRLFYWYGILPAAVIVALILALMIECSREQNAALCAFLVFAAVYTVVEAHLVSVYIGRNMLLLCAGAVWYRAPVLADGVPYALWKAVIPRRTGDVEEK